MHKLVPTLLQEMAQAFPELNRAEALITETLKLEELRFKKTLARGLKLLDDEVKNLPKDGTLAGDIAFKLYDTYGFPLDLTQDVLRTRGLSVDEDGFRASMERQKAAARAAWKGSGSEATEEIWFDALEEFGATEFVGYGTIQSEGTLVQIITEGRKTDKAKSGDQVSLLFNQTPFYGESGGQMGDSGMLTSANGVEIEISGTSKKLGKLHVHKAKIIKGDITAGDILLMIVDADNRDRIRANHSVTHILHAALRNQLGDHVTQKGSMVASDRLRFDFSQNKALTSDEKTAIERTVNKVIRQNSAVTTQLMTPDEAVESGAMALFGEKYGDEVRVVSMGDESYSVELCGGTHVVRTGDIGTFKIISESAVAAGVRRIEAVTAQAAIQYNSQQELYLNEALAMMKTTPAQLTGRLSSLLEDRKAAEKEITELRKKIAMGRGASSGGSDIKTIGSIKFIGRVLDGVPPKDLRGIADEAKGQLGSGVIALIAVNDGKAGVLVAVTDDLKEKINAVDLVRAGAGAVGGKGGGGRPDMAQAGGPDGAKADQAIAAIEDILAKL